MVKESKESNESPGFLFNSFLVVGLSGAIGYAILTSDVKLAKDASQLDKLLFTLRWQMFSCMTLIFSIMRTGVARVKSGAIDPLKPADQAAVEKYSRRLQNTLEQLAINLPGQLALSTFLNVDKFWIIPLLVLVFVTGRVLFFLGYPLKRAPGFMLTLFPTLGTYLACLYFMATSGPYFKP